jgi:hypothetical protein
MMMMMMIMGIMHKKMKRLENIKLKPPCQNFQPLIMMLSLLLLPLRNDGDPGNCDESNDNDNNNDDEITATQRDSKIQSSKRQLTKVIQCLINDVHQVADHILSSTDSHTLTLVIRYFSHTSAVDIFNIPFLHQRL